MLSLEQLAFHQIATNVWNILDFQGITIRYLSTIEMYSSDRLQLYQNKVLKVLATILPPGFPKLLKDKLMDATIDLQLSYAKAFDFTQKYRYFIFAASEKKVFEIECQNSPAIQVAAYPVLEKYKISSFIRPLGCFDDLSWAKLFVVDEYQPLHCRFYLACYYCFENVIRDLYCTMKDNRQIPTHSDVFVRHHLDYDGELILLWASYLENYNDEESNFYVRGFHAAFKQSQEHATKYFWSHCSADQQAEILASLINTELDSLAISGMEFFTSFVHFIYSLLSVRLKESLFTCNANDSFNQSYIFTSLFSSSYYKSILDDILTFPYPLPFVTYEHILQALAFLIRQSSIPLHKRIFKMILNHLPHERWSTVLQSYEILKMFYNISDFYLFEMIVLHLPSSMKDKIVLSTCCAMNFWFMRTLNPYDHEGLLRSLFLFLLDCNTASRKLALRSDAENILNLSCKTAYNHCRLSFNCSCNCKQLRIVINLLRQILPSLKEVLEDFRATEHGMCSHDFLSKNVYPFLTIHNKRIILWT